MKHRNRRETGHVAKVLCSSRHIMEAEMAVKEEDKMCRRTVVHCQEQRDGSGDGGREGDLKENFKGYGMTENCHALTQEISHKPQRTTGTELERNEDGTTYLIYSILY
uniref:Uncharacterized protein n=1 Tax=Oryza punctata TaxID=4537 RepID=A0A0E0L1U7_ORYPU